MICSYAELDSVTLKAVQDLEKKLGKTVLAFSCRDINTDTLTEIELAELREVEQKLGLSLLVVR